MLYLTKVVDSGANVTDSNVKVTDENDKMTDRTFKIKKDISELNLRCLYFVIYGRYGP